MRARTSLAHLARGLLMGGADVIPGVSGGTMALIVGVYERLIEALRALASGRLRDADWGFLLPLGTGIALAVAAGSAVIPPLLDAYPEQAAGLFLGLVAASLAIPWRRMEAVGLGEGAAVLVAAVVAFVLVGWPPGAASAPGGARIFASAAVAVCAMILPGVSGAFLLEALGMYQPTLEALRGLDAGYVGIFLAGAAVGLGAFAKVLGSLLERVHDLTMAVLVGLMAGALRALWPWMTDDRVLLAPPADAAHVALVAGFAAFGFTIVTVLVRIGADRVVVAETPAGRPGPGG